jgi:hypothetical protein
MATKLARILLARFHMVYEGRSTCGKQQDQEDNILEETSFPVVLHRIMVTFVKKNHNRPNHISVNQYLLCEAETR